MAVDIDSLQIEIEATSSDAATKINQLTTALSNLKSVAKGGAGLTTVSRQLQALSNAAKMIGSVNTNTAKLRELTSALNGLATIQKASGLTSTINALKKLPDITSQLGKTDLGKFASEIKQVAAAMAPLASEMQKVANGFSAFPIRIQKLIKSNEALVASNNEATKSFGFLGTGISSSVAKFGIYFAVFRQIAGVMANWVKESNDYVENLNLFTVAMGGYAEEAKTYAEEVQSVMGIDASEWMRNQGVFMQMASGFGVVSEDAALMSKNLTQLGYDISSFYNISIEDAMQKLQSGIAGEIEPLRRLGYAIDQASLEQVALNHGITESVMSMTQAEKSQLRYVAIMEQSTNAMGDLARTIQTPANAMRILQQQITQLERALGNLLIPILQVIIPYVQAFVEVLTEAVQALAVFIGFELPEIDYSGIEGVSSSGSDAEESLEGAADAAKELKNAVLGIDELNIISPPETAAGNGNEAAGGQLDIELPEYDFLNGLQSELDELKEKMEPLLDLALKIGAAILAWAVGKKIISGLTSLGDMMKNLKANADSLKKGLGLITLSLGVSFLIDNIRAILAGEYKNVSPESFVKILMGGALVGLGLVALGASGWAIPIAIAAAFVITDIVANWDHITGMWEGILDGIKSLFTGDMDGFWDSITDAFYQWATADSWMLQISKILVEALFGEGVWENAVKYLEEGGSLKDVFDRVGELVQLQLSEKWNSVVEFFTVKIPELIQSIQSWFSELPGKIGYSLGATIGMVSNWYVNVHDKFRESVKNINNAVIGWFSELPGKIYEAILGFYDYVIKFRKNSINWFSTEIPKIISSIVDWFKTLPQRCIDTIVEDANEWAEIGNQILNGIFNGLSSFGSKIQQFGEGFLSGFRDFFGINSPSVLFKDEIGYNLGAGIAEGITDSTSLIESAAQAIADSVQKVFNGITYDPSVNYMELINEAKAMGDMASAAMYESQRNAKIAGEGITDYAPTYEFTTALEPTNEYLSISNERLSGLNTLSTEGNVLANTGNELNATRNELLNTGLENDQTMHVEFVELIQNIYDDYMGEFRSALNTVVTNFTSLKSGIASGFSRTYTEIQAAASRIVASTDQIRINIYNTYVSSGFASGGYPAEGQMFIAREAGPELVGRIGNRTAVVNNDQIVASVSQGVYDAMTAAMQTDQGDSNGRDINLNVYLDGKQIRASMKKADREAGASIMSGGVRNG